MNRQVSSHPLSPFIWKCTVTAVLVAAASFAYATNYTFQGTGGDLATPANWGATTLTSSDVGSIASGGTYTLSQDLSLSQLVVGTTDQCVFDFREPRGDPCI